jgi:cytochrome bd-type quinol oxidase subunit 1
MKIFENSWKQIDFISNRVLLAFTTLLLTGFIGPAMAWIIAYPGGLVGVIGNLLAITAQATNNYNLDQLLAGFGLSMLLFVCITIGFYELIFRDYSKDGDDEDDKDDQDY